jgi:hypothetical protein
MCVPAPREIAARSDFVIAARSTFAEEGGKTRVNVRMLFESAALRDKVAKEFGAVEGLHQTLERRLSDWQGLASSSSAARSMRRAT